jgi:hypothetical protein
MALLIGFATHCCCLPLAQVIKASLSLARAVTVATRFSAVRQQGFAAPTATPTTTTTSSTPLERAVLDYPTQQRGLFPLLALAYALHFTGEHMAGQYSAYLKDHDESVLPALHATSAGLKALVTQVYYHCVPNMYCVVYHKALLLHVTSCIVLMC